MLLIGGDRNVNWPVKKLCFKPPWDIVMLVNVSWRTKSCGLSSEDAQDKDDWSLKVKG